MIKFEDVNQLIRCTLYNYTPVNVTASLSPVGSHAKLCTFPPTLMEGTKKGKKNVE